MTSDVIDLDFYLLTKKGNAISEAYAEQMMSFMKDALGTAKDGETLANVTRIPEDKTYLLTEPENRLVDLVAVMAPDLIKLANGKKLSLGKFLGPLTADDFIAFANYHETRHAVQDSPRAPDLSKLDLDDNVQSRKVFEQIISSGNRGETEADSFAALKFISDTAKTEDVPRRIKAVKSIAKLRLLGIASGQSDTSHDTYGTLSKTITLIENAHNQNWNNVQNQFAEMYQNIYPGRDLAQTRQMAKAATKFVAKQGIRNMSDDQYRDLSTFMSKAYAPNDEQMFAVTMHSLKISSNGENGTLYETIKQSVGEPSAEGQAYLNISVRLAADAVKSALTPATAPISKPLPVSMVMR